MALHHLYAKLLQFKASRPAPGKVPPAHYEALRQHHLQNHLRNVALIQQAHQIHMAQQQEQQPQGGKRGR